MKMTRKYLLLILIIMVSHVSFGSIHHSDTLISKANEAYNQGLYDSAIATYSLVLDQNLESYQLYYNMGNAYFKKNDLASAILFYEKAKKIAQKRFPDEAWEVHNGAEVYYNEKYDKEKDERRINAE